jgi:putative phosphoesterase
MPQRCPAYPERLREVFAGVDVILHAGDVGELWVLDRLSDIAPVVAVHGNDDTQAAQRELPYQQVLSVAGQRILLWHSHYPNRKQELASRGGSLSSKVDRQAKRGRSAGASIVVCGHFHVPAQRRQRGVLVVNPGSLASDSLFTRIDVQTVALLLVYDDRKPQAFHVDLANPDRVYVPDTDWDAGVADSARGLQSSIVEAGLLGHVRQLKRQEYQDLQAVADAILPLSWLCWSGQKRYITRDELVAAVESDPHVLPADREAVLAILSEEDT